MTGWALPEQLRSDVRSPDLTVRRAAVEDLGGVLDAGEAARAELERVAASDVPEVAELARRILDGWRPPRPGPGPDVLLYRVVDRAPRQARRPVPPGTLTGDQVRSASMARTTRHEGYDTGEVDQFLATVAEALDRRWAALSRRGTPVLPAPGALTPRDVMDKRFASGSFREGYDEEEVDGFLDRVVTSLRSLDDALS